MKKQMIATELAKQIFFGDLPENSKYKWLYEANWYDDGKYQCSNVYYTHNGKIYAFGVWRTGSYYSDYTWFYEQENETEITEVDKFTYVFYRLVDDQVYFKGLFQKLLFDDDKTISEKIWQEVLEKYNV